MGSAVIFSGTKVKTLKSAIDLNGGNDIISSATDPTSSAVSANIGSLLLNTSSGKLYRKNDSGSSTNWTEVGASGQAGINYISNPNAATNTTGWSTYADAAGSAPVDGTGGSPNVTWTRSTTTPLRGAAEFVFSKDAVNRQGQGVSIDFTIDNADIAKPLTVTFDYEIVSGTYATGDLTVYLIADPAGTPVVIQPAGYQIQSATASTKMRNISTFQTQASGTSYRLCFHVASTSASAYDLGIDNVVCGPQVVQYGAPVTDWVSYTPSWNGFGTPTSVEVAWRRVGDSVEIKGNFTTGTTTAVEARIGLPPGFTSSDTTKIPSIQVCGNLFRNVGTAGNGFVVAIEPSVTYMTLGQFTNSAVPLTKVNGTSFGNTEKQTFTARVPIQGLSSTVVMSNDTDTRVVALRAVNGSGSTTTFATGSSNYQTIGNLTSVTTDTHGAFNSSTSVYTVPVPGLYRITVSVYTNSTAMGISLGVKQNSTYNELSNFNNVTSASSTNGSIILNCKAGDTLTPQSAHTNAGNQSYAAFSPTYFVVERLTGPSAIAASETVSAAYHIASGAGQSVANTGSTIINYGNKVFDSHNAVTTGASWKFTAPVAGRYQVNASLYYLSSAYSIGNIQYLDIFKNGVYLTGGPATTAQTTTSVLLSEGVSSIISLNAGDYIDIRANNNRTAGATTTGDGVSAAISIVKVGI